MTGQPDIGASTVGGRPLVFVSYAHEDQGRLPAIVAALEAAGFDVWWDRRVIGGERFSHVIDAALEKAQAVVVLWSQAANRSHWVQDEAGVGRDRGVLAPASLDGVQPPLGFRQFHAIDLSGGAKSGGDGLAQLARAVGAITGAEISPPPIGASRPLARRSLLIAGAASATIGGVTYAWWSGAFSPNAPTEDSVAVLPFVNISGDPGQTYFADGLAAEIRGRLAANPLLKVVGQVSSNAARAKGDDARAIARELGVRYLLDGNVRVDRRRVRVAAELTEGRAGFSRWSQTFDRPMDDIFALQSEIAEAVSGALTRTVSNRDASPTPGGSTNVAAFDAYLRGKAAFALAAGENSDREALARFDEALAIDPRFAAAHAARSRTLAAVANQHAQGRDRAELYRQSIAAAREAVRLAPNLADAHSALGYALISGALDVRGAAGPYDRSYALGQGDADVLARYGLFCAQTGRFAAAEKAIAQAMALDPINARTAWNLGYARFAARRFADAVAPMQRALTLNPKMTNVRGYIGFCLMLQGRDSEAEAMFRQEPGALERLPGLAIINHRAGRQAQAQAVFAQLQTELGDNGLYQQAEVLAQWGRLDAAVATLNRARQAGDSGLFLAGQDPLLDPLRSQAGFQSLMRDLGFS